MKNETCLALLERIRWPEGVRCIRCSTDRISRVKTTGKSGKPRSLYECMSCGYQFTATTGTIFHNSHLPLAKWFLAISFSANGMPRVSVNELSQRLGVHYRTARRTFLKLRAAAKDGNSARFLTALLENLQRSGGSRFDHEQDCTSADVFDSAAPGTLIKSRVPDPAAGASQIKPAGFAAWHEQERTFRSNWSARSSGRPHAIGLVVPDLVHQFFAQIATGIMRRLRMHGYSLLICSSGENSDCERQEIEDLMDSGVGALVIVPTQGTLASLISVRQRKMPFVLVDRELRGMEANYVGVDNEEVGRIAVAHLVECGCRRIAHIRGAEISTAVGRLNGYRAAIRERGLISRSDYVVRVASADDLAERSGYEAMQSLLTLKPTPDAVFCHNDSMAVGAMSAIFQAKLSVPDDIAVLGVGDIPHARLLRVPLTSFDQKSDVVGEQAAQLVLKMVKSTKSHPLARILLKPSLVVRRSTAGFRGMQNLSRWGDLRETGGI